jgi:hypothetical protein
LGDNLLVGLQRIKVDCDGTVGGDDIAHPGYSHPADGSGDADDAGVHLRIDDRLQLEEQGGIARVPYPQR